MKRNDSSGRKNKKGMQIERIHETNKSKNLAMNNQVVMPVFGKGFFSAISSNRYLVSLAAVFVILGSRDLIIEMNGSCKSVFHKPLVKKITLFCVMFLYARDIASAVVVSVVIMCIFPDIFFEETHFKVDTKQLKCY